ncbi:MAG: rod-binding protein, partial [Candidatus Omnitrophica bacterium]|nr:rod-binding protein [Candidatus Omnitrophota bacterium]
MNLNAASVYPVTGSLSAAGGLDEIQTIASRASNGEKMSEEELQKVGQKFEALLLHNLLSTMRDSLPENPLFSESEGEKMYWDMFDESMSEAAASGQSTGITQAIVEELKRQQEQVTPP